MFLLAVIRTAVLGLRGQQPRLDDLDAIIDELRRRRAEGRPLPRLPLRREPGSC